LHGRSTHHSAYLIHGVFPRRFFIFIRDGLGLNISVAKIVANIIWPDALIVADLFSHETVHEGLIFQIQIELRALKNLPQLLEIRPLFSLKCKHSLEQLPVKVGQS
jgi:hypothetical protein